MEKREGECTSSFPETRRGVEEKGKREEKEKKRKEKGKMGRVIKKTRERVDLEARWKTQRFGRDHWSERWRNKTDG